MLRISGPEGKKIAKEWRKLHNEDLHNLCFLSNIGMTKLRRIGLGGASNVPERGEKFI